MPDSVNKPAVEERDEAALELDRDGDAVRTIAIEEAGRGSVYRCVFVMDDTHRDTGAIRGRRMEEGADIVCRVKASKDCGLL